MYGCHGLHELILQQCLRRLCFSTSVFVCVCVWTLTGELPQQKLHQNTRSREPSAPAVRMLGLVGGLVQVPTTGPHQVTTFRHLGPDQGLGFCYIV